MNVGDRLEPATYTVTRADLVRYAGASGDLNVIHWSERSARAVGLPGVIAHGMLTMALGARYVEDLFGPASVVEYGVRFTGMVPVPDDDAGATVSVSGRVKARDDAAGTVTVELAATCGEAKVLGKASAVVRLG